MKKVNSSVGCVAVKPTGQASTKVPKVDKAKESQIVDNSVVGTVESGDECDVDSAMTELYSNIRQNSQYSVIGSKLGRSRSPSNNQIMKKAKYSVWCVAVKPTEQASAKVPKVNNAKESQIGTIVWHKTKWFEGIVTNFGISTVDLEAWAESIACRVIPDSFMGSPLEFLNLGIPELDKRFTGSELRAALNRVQHTAVGPENVSYDQEILKQYEGEKEEGIRRRDKRTDGHRRWAIQASLAILSLVRDDIPTTSSASKPLSLLTRDPQVSGSLSNISPCIQFIPSLPPPPPLLTPEFIRKDGLQKTVRTHENREKISIQGDEELHCERLAEANLNHQEVK
uniref:Uncharacterized protein n=1 Tax=Timema shepardi TaxID=629360 RepID=A0A7R9B4A4_TIMSH|nr:unnamed protein product [Timema shepardi]